MVVAEFLGTGILTMVVLAISKSTIGIPYFVSFAAGLAIVVGTFAFASVSGAHFNPAITIGLWSTRRIGFLKVVTYVAAQLLGAAAAYLLYTYFIGQHWNNSGKFEAKILVGESVGTFVFSLAWAAAAFRRFDETKAAAVVGVGLVIGIMIASSASAGFLNPAVALGARSWVWFSYVLGPILGSVIGFNLYGLLFAPAVAVAESATPPLGKKNKDVKKK
jgi:glycerol uptake facilitator protein